MDIDFVNRAIGREVAMELGMEPETFWSEIDEVVVGHFERRTEA